MNNNVITSSRQSSFLSCPRKHFWQYEVGLRKEATGYALRFGSAWARAMDARWLGKTMEEALEAGAPEGCDLDAYAIATLSGMLYAYYAFYGKRETCAKIHPEVQFSIPIVDREGWTADGKMDGLGTQHDGLSVLVEGKTTGDSLAPESEYWLRLSFNSQVMQYVLAAREKGWDLANVIYDVVRKPSIKPKWIKDLDKDGLKIVLDSKGKRVFLKNGKPRQSACKEEGQKLKQHVETPEEYAERLYLDIMERPKFYFERREVPILDDNLYEFEIQRRAIIDAIVNYRSHEAIMEHREQAWPRAIAQDNCKFCSYKSFCLQNIHIDLERPPEGFAVKPFNPELEKETTDATATEQDDNPITPDEPSEQ